MHFVGYFTIFNVIYILCLLLLLRGSFRSSTLGRLLSLSRLRTERVSGALILDLLDLLLRWWVSLEGNILPLLGGVVSSLDGRSKSNESLGDGRLESLRGELQFVSIYVDFTSLQCRYIPRRCGSLPASARCCCRRSAPRLCARR